MGAVYTQLSLQERRNHAVEKPEKGKPGCRA